MNGMYENSAKIADKVLYICKEYDSHSNQEELNKRLW